MKREESKERKEEFLRLRVVEGKSFESIAKELGVSKNTVLKWAKEMENELRNLEEEEKERLIEQYKAWKNARLESLLKLREKILQEIERRDIKDVPFNKLVEMLIEVERVLNSNLTLRYVLGERTIDVDFQENMERLNRAFDLLVCSNEVDMGD